MKLMTRRMLKTDLPQVLAIEQQLFADPWQAGMFTEEIDKHEAWVAINELNQIVGYLTGWLVADDFSLNNIAVDKSFQRKKIATKLLKEIIKKLRTRKCKNIFLVVRESNLAAIRLYEKFQFVIIGKKKEYYQKPVEDALVMKLEIEEK
ncbi:MAG TPA: ribosomal-protein-alanine N-acetyltransferase [Candidatus Cloacimonas sp.]|jgi:ribosomal-protein-alanine N-acetyltransferase|nr:ribosomal-protein-alanine N-acetyltransferase [Candidatus Cloacimonas sp.]